MRTSTPFLPGVHRILFGRKPCATTATFQQGKSKVDNLCLQQLVILTGGWLPELIASFKATHGDNSRDRVYTVAVTFWAFLSQNP